ncbi:glycosyl transferase [Pedobacter yulinensis]|uniref:Glycosyl transferase n=1 Tax=Pedobacter yulinensis TaxID=2126353 RepID=A0A2T3HLQ7_9SPHI|nr:glycosyltransferase family 2 protein [Pedobacter yulinensis]PST83364.1 glycosyl transferase [Pedobacter yulinensis]
MEIVFWIALFLIVYTYVGYGVLLFILLKVRRLLAGRRVPPEPAFHDLPSCTLIVAVYNETGLLQQKIANTLALQYPAGKLKFIFVTDGSTDGSDAVIRSFPQIGLLHKPGRAGKIAAVHRAMEQVDTEVVAFTDANTFLNPEALLKICRHYADAAVGAVAGEKRVMMEEQDDASAAGEGFYWKYESKLKQWDSELHSVVGAAGELFSVRRSLYVPVRADTILDDFMISMNIASAGYRIVYEPEAYAMEGASADVGEELKRKVRIAAGGIQSVVRLKALLLPFKYPVLSFQYVSHRVLRWTITPLLLILVFILNGFLAWQRAGLIYDLLMLAQVAFYTLAYTGYLLEKRQLKVKAAFIPYYFCMMNYAVLAGIIRYMNGKQSAAWEKARRK